MRTAILTLLALTAFASNSLLCRFALASGSIDPLTFTSLRLATGAVVLWLLVRLRRSGPEATASSARDSYPTFSLYTSALMLAGYAYAFSYAYVSLSTGTGALLLFASVQVTMIFWSLRSGHAVRKAEWTGMAMAVGGLVYLVLPGLSSPEPLGAALMCAAGVAWGVYTIRGRGATDPVGLTERNFVRTLPVVALSFLLSIRGGHWSSDGIAAAMVSGGVTSGLGYVVWYAALRGLTTLRAAVVQLCVPVLAALAGILLLGEPLTLRLVLSSGAILGGISWAVMRRG